MSKRLRERLLALAVGSAFAVSAYGQNTSSSISGRVVDAAGKPVAGATVEIVHVPSGTSRTVVTDADGRYSAQGLRVGGPFEIKASAADGEKADQPDVFLKLAEDTTLNLTVAGATAGATELGGVTVTAAAPGAIFQPDNKGVSTNVSQAQLKVLPNPDRSIQAIARLDPFIALTNNNNAGGLVQISALGQNNRYNNIMIDAVPTNDSFGLEANGLPAMNQPISYDAIEEYNISTANYDVTAKRSVGANINIVTKSGTNDFHGSVYYAYTNNDDLTGEDKNGNDFTGYDAKKIYGATFSGPLIKDTLFFFLSYEEAKTLAPAPDYGPLGSAHGNIVPITPDQLNQIIDIARNTWGLIPGDLNASNADQDEKKYLAKLDWNISDGHRLSFRASQTKGDQPIIQGNYTGSRPALGLSSYWYDQHRDLKQFVANLYDDWTDQFSTEASVSYAKYDSTPTTLADQPMVQVYINNDPTTTNPSVYLGEDQYRHYNVLGVKTWNAFFAGNWFLGDHTVKAGFDFQRDEIYNLFGRTEFGSYVFNSIADFQAGNYSSYTLYQPAPGYSLGDIAAKWRLDQWGLFVQDTWQMTPQFSLTYGLRRDLPLTPDRPVYNESFASQFGLSNRGTVSGHGIWEPRVSFNYTFDTERPTQLRGGIGVSESVTPGVWLSNPFTNNGVTLTSATSRSGTFNPDPYTQQLPSGSPPAPEVDLLDKNFKLPTVLKMSLGFDRELPWWNLVFSADYVHLQNENAILYQNVNLGAPTGVLPDGRLSYWANPYYNFATGQAASGPLKNRNPNFYDVMLLTNTNEGKADFLSLTLHKPFTENLSGSVSAVFGRATDVNSGTSSQATSSWTYNSVYNPNEDVATPSNYNVRQRLLATLTWQHKFFGDYATSVSGVYDGHSGQPYSWVSGTDVSGICYSSATNCPYGLIYVPRPGDVEFANGTDQKVIDQFYGFIHNNDYLRKHQGGVTGRNGATAPWVNRIDMSLRQEIPGLFEGNKGEIRFDFYNVLNMLNKKWGDIYDQDFPYARTLANVVGVDPVTGRYVYALPTRDGNYAPGAYKYENDHAQSVWSIMVTLRYTF
ncbi:MAG TPA: carboxypeptidase regulatory-like domain-containing protein [Dokdonella sp.]